jgi:hypothetical protein
MKRSILLISVLLLGLLSCRKDPLLKDNTLAPPDVPGSDLIVIHTTNPFEELGAAHNKALDFVASRLGFPHLSPMQTFEAVHQFLNKQYPSPARSIAELNISKKQNDLLFAAGANAPRLLLQLNKISPQGKLLLDELYALVFTNNSNFSPMNPELNTKVAGFEDRVYRTFGRPSSNLNSNTEIALILASAAIARYSYSYWYNAFYNANNPWHVVFYEDHSADHRPFPQWLKTVWADICGFLGTDRDENGNLNLNNAVNNAGERSADA